MNVMQKPAGTNLTNGPRPGAPRSYKTFFNLHQYLTGKYCKNPKVPVVQLNVNSTRTITWLVGVTIYSTFFNNSSPPTSPVFMQQNTFEKN